MAESDFIDLTGSAAESVIRRGVVNVGAAGTPEEGGSFAYSIQSIAATAATFGKRVVGSGFQPTASGGSIRGCLKRGPSTDPAAGVSPFLFIAAQTSAVGAEAYILGLSDEEQSYLALRRGALSGGVPGEDVGGSGNILTRSTAVYQEEDWVHARMDHIINTNGDARIRVYVNTNALNIAPNWVELTEMLYDNLATDDPAPLTSGYMGFGVATAAIHARAYWDAIEAYQQT